MIDALAKWKAALTVMICASVFTSCAGEAAREQEATARAARLGHPELRYSEKVSPATAFALGFLPFGVAGLYVDDTKLAASGLLWPFSMVWVPKMAHDEAVDINHAAFDGRLFDALEKKTTPPPRPNDEDDEP